jgi:4-oxalocrotonate tautomerase
MPYINVKVTSKPDPALSARIAAQVSALTQAHLHKDPTVNAVTIDYVDPRHWFAGAKSLAEQGTNTYWLDIKVVDATNTKQEMAAYLEAINEMMSTTLGGVHGESYILVHEVPAATYGFGGKTQEFRFISGKLANPS